MSDLERAAANHQTDNVTRQPAESQGTPRTEKRCRVCGQAHWRAPAGWIADHTSEPVDMPIKTDYADLRRLAEQVLNEPTTDNIDEFIKEANPQAILALRQAVAERRVAALTDALASAEARVSGLEEGLRWALAALTPYDHPADCSPDNCVCGYEQARALLTSGEPEGPAAPPADRHGGAIRVPVVVEWTSDEAYLRGWTEARALVDLNQMASVLAHYDITDTDWERLQTVLRGPVSEASDE